ncbi:uncharacterized protein DUF3347 [Pedobacter nutrimenti]|uniref:Uncharacterized protein DUF3347 n=2 Tax=Pedobacter nutrimenti TaxID=1241337 RepID=A0A318UE67_9SPHI|nr:uncharacterized protein DUF3347 [Pedobacter nutrimenti]
MKTGMKSIFLLGMVVLMAACNSNQKTEDSHEGHDHSQEAPAAVSSALTASVKIKDDKLNAVYQHYIHLTTALTNDNTAEAKVAASAIEIGAKQIDGGATLAKAAAEITESKDIEAQRTTYASLSSEFISLLKKAGVDSGELYISHCPMALNDKGADWVSNSKEIRNPYFGESMLTCGSVKETIK